MKSIDDYLAAFPDATIVNSATGLGGVRLVAGFGAPAWNNFIGNADAFTIGVGSNSVTYDFELFNTPTNKAQCKNGGWATFNPPAGPFKNQGDCIQYVNTGK